MGIGGTKRRRAQSVFDGMKWGEGSVGTDETTDPAIRDTSWEKPKQGYGSGWQQPGRTTKAERRAKKRSALYGLLDARRNKRLKDPHEDDDKGKVQLNREGDMGYLADALKDGGSVIAAQDGLCLDGEENGAPPSDGSTYAYTFKNGERKWRKTGDEGENGDKDGEDEDGEGLFGVFAWDAKKKQIRKGNVLVGRKTHTLAASGANQPDGFWSVKVTFTENGVTLAYHNGDGNEENTDTITYLPLYWVKNGRVEEDWRNAFVVQCWE